MVMQRTAVIGHPIAQSKSPPLHMRWIKANNLEAEYIAIDGEDEEKFRKLIKTLPEEGYLGVNVTLPFKHLAHELSDELSEVAEAVGAVNLIVFRDGKVIGDNTDVSGFSASLQSLNPAEPPKTARLLGAGGAAPAIIVALKNQGFERIEITNRTASKASELGDRYDIETVGWAARDARLGDIDLLVNTTALGMLGQPELDMHISGLPDHAIVIDIVTTPPETKLLKAARERGLLVMNGLPMLVHQAVPSFEAWFGIRPTDEDEALEHISEEV